MKACSTLLLFILAVVGGGFLAVRYAERHYPEHLPWTPLDLGQPIGTFTGRKLAALSQEPVRCRQLLEDAHIDYTTLPSRKYGQHCGYDQAVRLSLGEKSSIGYNPQAPVLSCPLAAALILWERAVVQPAARQHLNSSVVNIRHFGTYACRRIYGGSRGNWSEHSTANAIDVGRFDLENSSRVSVAASWDRGTAEERAFLREVREGSCHLFATVLGPEYNEAHQDHFHLDQASRGAAGWRMCR